MNRNMGGDKTSIHMHQYNPPNMALGCFIGVMVLLVIIIFFLGFSDNRLNQMLTNQNNTIAAINKMAGVFGIGRAIQHHKGKGNFVSRQTAGGSTHNIPVGAYANGAGLALNNTQFSDYGLGSNGSCSSNGASQMRSGNQGSFLEVISSSTDPSAPQVAQNAAQREAQLFIDMGVIAEDVLNTRSNGQAPMRR